MNHREERNRRSFSTAHRAIQRAAIRPVIALVVGAASPGKETAMPSNGHQPLTATDSSFDTVTSESTTTRP